ncbi:uncharacterized protein K452DRAFT_306517 [Aplosporella prunicola CBS 121167]|uniref:Nucleoporin NUP37 n=1 Tax=Aplosporella prunicola CBS 121167 TaxID=1176127 RepID=A0A6A6BL37_9PEZI|nr:uncharacterized protein K452DRAFT_306517 [Aplosporella prunicola CBS 121167]KAF2144746.1 hypothetical protein K452DRAFT_306517 [Aplosporella prunicola CBS 121167]
MSAPLTPRVSRKSKLLHLSYDLPHRVNVAGIYPKQAPNGSTVIVYGHSNGLRIVWRGGRPLKTRAAVNDDEPKVNGTSKDVVMVDLTDDDDDETPQAPSQPAAQDAEFEPDEDEQDEAEPYPRVVQHLDLPLGTEVLYLSFPHIPSVSPYRPADSIPPIFNQKIVFSVACADSSVRVITLPLLPPSEARKAADPSKHKAPYGEQILRIEGQHGHQVIPNAVSMTWSSRDPEGIFDDVDMDVEESDEEDGPRRRRRIGSAEDEVREWDLFVASHSNELSGLLHIFCIPLISNGDLQSLSTDPIFPYRTQYLSSPASHIAFSSAQYPSQRHLQVLAVDTKGSVRIYDPLAPIRMRPRSSRSVNTDESRLGAWVAAFSTGFEMPKQSKTGPPGLAHRRRILDAKWTSDGKSILALLSDGEWGVWDVDGSGPGASRTKTVSTFAIRGFISGTTQATTSTVAPTKTSGSFKSLALAPMTPNTRRAKEENLFHGPATAPTNNDTPRGGISVSTSVNNSTGAVEDSVVLWYGDEAFRIPHLQQFWARSGSSTLYGPGLTKVDGLNLQGEMIGGIEQFARKATEARMGIPRDLLIRSESRLIVLAHSSPSKPASGGSSLFAKELEERQQEDKIDRDLLKRGELDLGGMDRLLEGMTGGAGEGPVRRVGFTGLASSR